MKNEFVINEVKTEKEIVCSAQLADEIWHECYAELLQKEQIDYMVERFQSAGAIAGQMREGYRYYLAQVRGEPVGYMGVQPKEGKLFLSKFYLKKEWRGSGLAGEMFAFVEQLCSALGCRGYWLTVNKGNERAKRAYEKAGMRIVREQVAEIGEGFVMDDYVFEKTLHKTR